jgi:hypothetical protein
MAMSKIFFFLHCHTDKEQTLKHLVSGKVWSRLLSSVFCSRSDRRSMIRLHRHEGSIDAGKSHFFRACACSEKPRYEGREPYPVKQSKEE